MRKTESKTTISALQKFIKNTPHGTWLNAISSSFGVNPPPAARAVEEKICEEIAKEAARPTIRWQRLRDWLLLGIALTRGQIIADYETTKHLTPSKIGRGQLRKLAGFYKELARESASWLSTEQADRLNSYAEFTDLFKEALPSRQQFESILRSSPPELLRCVLTLSEHQFSGLEPILAVKPDSPFSYSRSDISAEDFANGVSYILTAYNRLTGIRFDNFRSFNVNHFQPHIFTNLVIEALRLFFLDEAEVDVFRAGHCCEKRDANTWLVEPPSEEIGRAFELGNIETIMQEGIRQQKLSTGEAMRFEDLADYWFSQLGEEIFTFPEQPLRRLCVKMPDIQARALGENILLKDIFFAEEQALLAGTCYELVTEVDDVKKFLVTDKLSLWDILVVSRIFRLLAYGWNQSLRNERNRDQRSFLNSSFPVISITQLIDLLTAFGIDREKARQYIDLFKWDVRQRTSYADIQYRPFVFVEEHFIVPLNIHVSSNLFRNVLLTQQRRLSSGTQPDLVSERLYQAILKNHSETAQAVKFRFQGEESDFDVVFRLDTTLFVFECKNTLKPTSSFEMRATLDQLDKAAFQLDRAKRLWADRNFRLLLQKNVGFSLDGVTHLETAIVLSHRLFSGANYHQHPVRHLYSLSHFITVGEIYFSVDGKDYIKKNWSGTRLTSADLIEFLSSNAGLYKHFWKAQVREEHRVRFGAVSLLKPRFPLDIPRLIEELGSAPNS